MNLPFTVRQKGALRSGQIDRKEGTVVKILNFGSLNLDKVYKVAHFVREGETISAQEQNQFLGGKGLNQSVALARAGIFVEHAGAVGRETTEFHALLKAEGAGTTYLRVLETVSGHAVIQSCAGQNCIIVYGGANRMTRPQDVDAFLKDYGPGDLLLLQNETSCVRYAMEQAREKGMTVAFAHRRFPDTGCACTGGRAVRQRDGGRAFVGHSGKRKRSGFDSACGTFSPRGCRSYRGRRGRAVP